MAAQKKQTMTREQAFELYDDLQKSLNEILKKNPPGAPPPKNTQKNARIAQPKRPNVIRDEAIPAAELVSRTLNTSRTPTVTYIIFLAIAMKITLSVLEMSGILTATPVEAAVTNSPTVQDTTKPRVAGEPFSREEVQILTSLDTRRAELEERRARLDTREQELNQRDNEFVTKVAQLKELTGKLKSDREQSEKRQNVQLEQLANVYNAMNPNEAAQLLEQLDSQIALSLVEHMSEKRIGQILPLMSPARALSITRMLSGKVSANEQ